MYVPVLDNNKQPLMPCTPRRARKLMENGIAIPYYQKGFFCIRLLREPSGRNSQPIALGIDPGSKREAYTAITKKAVVINITSNTPDWVKAHVKTCKVLRRARRSRKTPYRKMRANRASLRSPNRIPPSIKARWQAKLRIVKVLCSIMPITHINVEDIRAVAKKGKKLWNVSFSPLEVGKAWFYAEFGKLNIQLLKMQGFNTKLHRDKRNFKKSKDKLSYAWDAHNVDSHSLAEMALNVEVKPNLSVYKVNFLQYHKRKLHVENFAKGGKRKSYGTTVSLGLSRGSVIRHKGKLAYLGGTSKGRLSVYNIETNKRITQNAKKEDIKIMYIMKFSTIKPEAQFLPPQTKFGKGFIAH